MLLRAGNRGVLGRFVVVLALGMTGAISCDRVESTNEPRTAPVADDDADLTSRKPVRAKVVGGQPMKRIVAWPDPAEREALEAQLAERKD